MIYAEKNKVTGRLTGRWKNIRPAWINWTEYESVDEFQADLAVDLHDLYHTPAHPSDVCVYCKSEGWA